MWEMWLFSTLIFCAHEFVRWYFLWRFTENKVHYSLFSVNLHGKRTIIFAIFCEDNLGIHGRWRHLTTPKLLLLTNQSKLTLTVTLTLTDTVTVIFFSRISSTPIKRLYRNSKRNFCGGAERGSVSDLLAVCWQEFDSKFILYRWKEGFLWGYIRKRG